MDENMVVDFEKWIGYVAFHFHLVKTKDFEKPSANKMQYLSNTVVAVLHTVVDGILVGLEHNMAGMD
jgi:hypothetical protein